MRDLAGHQELQRVLRSGIGGEVDQALVDDLGACLCRDVAAQVDVELAGDLQVVGGPRVALRVEQIDAPAAGDGNQRVGLGVLAIELHRFEMQPRQRSDDFEMAQLLGADVHQEIFPLGILAVQTLNRILHCGGELSVGPAELLEQHVSELRIRCVDAHGVHQLLDVVIHASSWHRAPA